MTPPSQTRSAFYSKPGQGYQSLDFTETALPSLKGSEVLVKIHAVSLNYRDLMIARGVYPIVSKDKLVPCSDMAGEVVAVGEDVSNWKTGDRVCANFSPEHIHGDPTEKSRASVLGAGEVDGVLTQYKIFKEYSLIAIPKHLSYEEASTLPCAAVTAYNALMTPVPVKAGDTVLVQGTGGVSIFALQFAVASGATVIATSSSDDKLEVAKKLGAHHVINYKKTPDWDKEVLKLTNNRGVDYTIEVGGPGTLQKSFVATRISGFISIIGALAVKESNDSGSGIFISAIFKNLNLRGILVGSVESFQQMNRLISAHPETTRPVIDKVFDFTEATKALEHLESQQHVGKIVIKVA
ncbi:NAD-P-binding protein [Marasmius fiardii PR-910]|nr:NAD-P-binding protein [Marasmius fiardii PR-910]